MKLHSVGAPKTAPYEFYAVTNAETIVMNEALVLTAGLLTKCAATATPEFIAGAAIVGNGTKTIPVIRVVEDMVFETEFSADASAVAEGSKVTLDADGVRVTATTASGVFYITKKLGTGAATTKVRGMFRR